MVNESDDLSTPDIADRHRRHMALAMLTAGLAWAAGAVEPLTGPETARLIEMVQIVMAALTFLLLGPMIVWKLRNRDRDLRHLYHSEDGYVAQTLGRAKNASWVATFVLIAFLSPVAGRFEAVPAEFFLKLTMSGMLVVFAGAFLFLNRNDIDSDLPDDARA